MEQEKLDKVAGTVMIFQQELLRITRERQAKIDRLVASYRARLIAGERSTDPIVDLVFATESGRCDEAFLDPLEQFREKVTRLTQGEAVAAFWRADVSRGDEDPQYFWHIFFGRRGPEEVVQYTLEYFTSLPCSSKGSDNHRFGLSLALRDTFYWDSFTLGSITPQEVGKIGPLFMSPGQHGASCTLDSVIVAHDPRSRNHHFVQIGEAGVVIGSEAVTKWLATLPAECQPVRDAILGRSTVSHSGESV